MDMENERSSGSATALIDTHCHLDDPQFDEDRTQVLARSRDASVVGWLLIGYDPANWSSAIDLAQRTPGMRHSLGVHPSRAQAWTQTLADDLRTLVVSSGAVAIGEIGLDFYRDNAPFALQAKAFTTQLRIARDLALPAIFHMRDAESEMLKLLHDESSLPKMVFHSFDGSPKLTDFILQNGAYVGVGGLATRQKSEHVRDELRRIPLERMILETDSPYLVPARQKARRNEPNQVPNIAAFLAELLETSLEVVTETTTRNAESLFGRFLS